MTKNSNLFPQGLDRSCRSSTRLARPYPLALDLVLNTAQGWLHISLEDNIVVSEFDKALVHLFRAMLIGQTLAWSQANNRFVRLSPLTKAAALSLSHCS